MVGKMWPALKSCKHQCYEESQLNQLSDDLLLLIMSFLTMKEAARTSVLSHRWNNMWRCLPVLIFEDYPAMKRMLNDEKSIPQERLNFLRWVNQVLDANLGQSIDELKVIFDLDKYYQSDVDRWVVFALTKQVKRLELNFAPLFGMYNDWFPKLKRSIAQHHIAGFKSCLRSLCLKYVNITSKDVDCLLRSCMVLENLCIFQSQSLRHFIAFDSPLQLKHLEVSYCERLRTIDISAPKLLSFINYGSRIDLRIRNASLLVKLSLGESLYAGDIVAYASNATESISKYFSQLEYLSWSMRLLEHEIPGVQWNLRIHNPPAMTNLKHLELDVLTTCEQSLFGLINLIDASPLLQRLTLKFCTHSGNPYRKIVRRNGHSLKSLQTLELCGNIGLPIDLEFATYVFENSIMLKDVIAEIKPFIFPQPGDVPLRDQVDAGLRDQVANIERIVPQGVKLTLKVHNTYSDHLPS